MTFETFKTWAATYRPEWDVPEIVAAWDRYQGLVWGMAVTERQAAIRVFGA